MYDDDDDDDDDGDDDDDDDDDDDGGGAADDFVDADDDDDDDVDVDGDDADALVVAVDDDKRALRVSPAVTRLTVYRGFAVTDSSWGCEASNYRPQGAEVSSRTGGSLRSIQMTLQS